MQELIPATDIVNDVFSKIESRYSGHLDGERHWIKAPRFSFSNTHGIIPKGELIHIQSKSPMLRDLLLAWLGTQLALKQKIPVVVLANPAQSRLYIELSIASMAEVSPKAITTGIFHREFWPVMTRAAGSLLESGIFFLDPNPLLDLEKAVHHLWEHYDSAAFVACSSLKESINRAANIKLADIYKSIWDGRDFGVVWVGGRATSLSAHKTPTSLRASARKMNGQLHEIIVDGWLTDTVTDGILVGVKPTNERNASPELFD